MNDDDADELDSDDSDSVSVGAAQVGMEISTEDDDEDSGAVQATVELSETTDQADWISGVHDPAENDETETETVSDSTGADHDETVE